MKITIVYGEAQFTFDSTGKTIEPVCGVWGLGTDFSVHSGYDNEHDVSDVARLLATGTPHRPPRMRASGLRLARHFDGAVVGGVGAAFGAKNCE